MSLSKYQHSIKSSTLMVRWVFINALLTALFTVGYLYGVLDQFITDDTYLTQMIIGVGVLFIIGSGFTAWDIQTDWKRAVEYQLEYHSSKYPDDSKELIGEYLSSRLTIYGLAGPVLVGLGLLGTVIGISLAFSEISPDVIADVQASTGVMALLLSGLSTAFHTTLAGIVGMLWNMINLHIMQHDSSRLYTAIIGGTEIYDA